MNLRRPTLLVTASACAALAVPSLASAKDFCVAAPAGCAGTPVTAAKLGDTLIAAQANGTDDRFFLAPGTYQNAPIVYNSLERLELIGKGRDKTVLTTTGAAPVLFLGGGNKDTSVSDLALVPAGDATMGLSLDGARAERVAVNIAASDTAVAGVLANDGAVLRQSEVHDDNQGRPAVAVTGGRGTVADSVIETPRGFGVLAASTDATVRRSRISAHIGAAVVNGHISVSDTFIDVRDPDGGLGVVAPTSEADGFTLSADLDRVTIAGSTPGGKTSAAIGAEATGAGRTATINLRDSVITGFGISIVKLGQTGGLANIHTDRSSYPNNIDPSFKVGPGDFEENNRLTGNPRFVNAAAGNYRLAADSPLIDAGTPGDLPAGTADRDGRLRPNDGNGDCKHVTDVGAFEFAGTATKAAARASASSAVTGSAIRFSSEGSCVPRPGAPIVEWSFSDGASASGASVTHAFAEAGHHTATVTVRDGEGHKASASVPVDVSAAPVETPPAATPEAPPAPEAPAAPAPPAPAPAPAPASPPVVSSLKVSPSRIVLGSLLPKRVARAARRPAGTIRFKLSRAARVELRFKRRGKTIKTRVRIRARAGVNRIRFAGRLSRKARLRPGAHRVTVVATDASGARSRPVSKRFRVVAAKRRH